MMPGRSRILPALLAGALFLSPVAALAELPDFVGLVKASSPAVVNINAVHEPSGAMQGGPAGEGPSSPFSEGTPFDDFLRRYFGDRLPSPQEEPGIALGSGFLISADGHILTNAHVVKGAKSITVRLSDHRELQAQVVGTDERTDVALLKVDAAGLPTVRLGDSDKLEVGEWVLAIGSPFGLEYTATAGIVSAVGRNLPSDTYVPFIQTDVAVNPGNSGGPLFNTRGEVVGINAQIFSQSGGYMGVSFAIPINLAMKISEQLRVKGYVTHGWLGVMIQGVSADLAKSFGLDRARGALVSQVVADGPAAKAGLQPGDIILTYDGKPVSESADLPGRVGDTPVGKRVPVELWRSGKQVRLDVTIEALPREDAAQAPAGPAGSKAPQLNISVAELSAEQRRAAGLGDRGVLVQQVGPGPAKTGGLRAGDVILSVAGKDVRSAAELASIVSASARGTPIPVLVRRGEGQVFLTLTLPATG